MSRTTTTKSPSGREACAAAIAAAGKPLTCNQMATAVVEAKVCPGLKGKTPKATLAAQVVTAAGKGVMFKRVGSTRPAKFELRRDVEPEPELVKALKAKVAEVTGKSAAPTRGRAPARAK